MGGDELAPTGTCDLTTVGRRSGRGRRVEIWYVVVDGHVVLTGTPGPRHWLANLRAHPRAVLHLRDPARDLGVTAEEVTDPVHRRRVAEEARRLQPWYAEQSYSVADWVTGSPMVVLTPRPPVPPRAPTRKPVAGRPADPRAGR
ncbi:MAG TPA: nitroreductase family deazaflavin-dependent oxidoreductase [Dermatophilaceae bacterium]|nr:nitroreductase family deazaflavin-dependent oxidoreductase [Dermatophilaceae bacterium]